MTDDDIRDELDAYLSEPYDFPEPVELSEQLVIASEHEAQRMMRRRARLIDEMHRVQRVASQEIENITAFVSDRVAGIEGALTWLDRGLEQWTRRMHEADPRKKSWAMPSGALKLRAPGAHATSISDPAAFMAWAAASDERGKLVKQADPEPDKAAIKAALKLGPAVMTVDGVTSYSAVDDGGEVVPGVVFTKPAEDAFTVTHPAHD